MITINGKTYRGNNVSIINSEVFIDGKRSDQTEDKVINITIDGNIDTVNVDYCNKIEITGYCGTVVSKNGNIRVNGDVTNKNGNIMCGNIGGDVETKNGNINKNFKL